MPQSRRVRFTALLVSAALLSGSLPVAAQGTKPVVAAKKKSLAESLTGEALAAFKRGVDLYTNARNYDGAVAEFQSAYNLSHDPRLLFNMAIAQRDAKHYGRAVASLAQELKEGESTLTADEKKTAQDLLEELKKFTAPITITANEPDAAVLVDGVEMGKTPLAAPISVDVGERVITLRKLGFLDATKRLAVSGGKAEKLDFTLEASQKRGKLVVRALGGVAASVVVDGIVQGPAPWEGEVNAGKHTIEVRADKFVTESRTETVAEKSSTIIEVTLRPDQGRVRIETDQTSNVITIDGNEVGRGTWEGTLSSGGHRLDVTRGGADPYSSELVVQTDQQRTVKVTLRSKQLMPWYGWLIGGVVVVGGGIGIYFAARPGVKDPQNGTISPGTVPVGWRF